MNGILLGVLEGVAATFVCSALGGIAWVIRLLRRTDKVVKKLDDDMNVVKPAVQNGSSVVVKTDEANRKLDELNATLNQHLVDAAEDRALLLETTMAFRSHIDRHEQLSPVRRRA